MFKNYYLQLIIVLSIFVIDRISKFYVIMRSSLNLESDILFSTSFLNIQLTWNRGIAFGLFSFRENFYYNIVSIIIVIVIIIIINLAKKSNKPESYFYLMIIGGAIGNLFDRLVYMAVPDFIDIYYEGFHWFIFNIADIFITFGVICLIIFEIFIKKNTHD